MNASNIFATLDPTPPHLSKPPFPLAKTDQSWTQHLYQSKKGFEIWPKRLIIFCCEEPDQQMWGVIQESSRRRLEATLVSFLITPCNFDTNTIQYKYKTHTIQIQYKYNTNTTILHTYTTQYTIYIQYKSDTFHVASYNFTAHDCLFSSNNPQMVSTCLHCRKATFSLDSEYFGLNSLIFVCWFTAYCLVI